MSVKENKDLIRRYLTINAAHIQELAATDKEEFCAPDFVSHTTTGDVKLKEYHKMVVGMATAFPDFIVNIEDIIGEGDKVMVRYKNSFTHKGTYMGIAPTGKKVSMEGISVYRIAGGKIVEAWGVSDNLGMMQQMGAIPASPPKK